MLPCNPVPVAAGLISGPATSPVQLVGRLNIVGVIDPVDAYGILPESAMGTRKTVYNEGGYPLNIILPQNVEFIVGGNSELHVTIAPGYAVEFVALDDQWLVFLSQ